MHSQDREKRFEQLFRKQTIDGLLLSSTQNIFYATGFSGFSAAEHEGYALVTSEKVYVFTDARLIDAVPSTSDIQPVEISAKSPFREQLVAICKKHKAIRIGFEPHSLTAAEFIAFKKLSEITLIPSNLDTLREIKTAEEIRAIEKACHLGDSAFSHILSYIKPGLSEKEIAAEIEIFFRRNLADISFPSIVAFGDHSAIPHHSPTDRVLKKQEVIKLDFGCKLDNYCSDMTRTIFVGKPTNEQLNVYETVKMAQEKSFAYLQTEDKIQASQIDQKARDYVMAHGYADFPHCSHGIGLEVHEAPSLSPRSTTVIQSGMVFSVEPGIYLSGKFGVRIEDIVAVENGKMNLLTRSSRELITI